MNTLKSLNCYLLLVTSQINTIKIDQIRSQVSYQYRKCITYNTQ